MRESQDQVLEYWNNNAVESMYDKHLLNAEIELITAHIPAGAKILDAGCSEGEETLNTRNIPGASVHAVDFSETRLQKASQRLEGRENVVLKKFPSWPVMTSTATTM